MSWDCKSCRENDLVQIRGCEDGKAEAPLILKTGVRFDYCPIRWVTEEASREAMVFQDVLRFKSNGILPDAGGMNDQDCLFIDALDIIENEISILRDATEKK